MFQNKIFKIKSKGLRTVLAAIFVAGRAEYFMADMLPYITGVFLGLSILSESDRIQYIDNSWYILLYGLLITICAHFADVWANNLGDYHLDKKFKPELPNSVDLIGKKRLWIFVTISIIIGTLLIIYISMINNTLIYIILWIIGMGIGLAYSCEPLRLKKYLLTNAITRGLPLIILVPFGYYLVTRNFSVPLVLYTLGIGTYLLGSFFGPGDAWDYKDDKGEIKTVGTVYGYLFGLHLSMFLMPFGAVLMMAGYSYLLSFSKIQTIIYLIIWICIIIITMLIFTLKIYLKRDNYDEIEAKCGLFTKAGTTIFWGTAAIGVIILAFS